MPDGREHEEISGEYDSISRDIGFGDNPTSGRHHYSIDAGYTVSESLIFRVIIISVCCVYNLRQMSIFVRV